MDPIPYSYTLRWQDQDAADAVGFTCVPPGGNAIPFSLQAYGGIPSRLNKGDSDLDAGENVSRQAWQNLHNGGMGALEAKDFATYRYASGIYTGDEDEIYVGPEPTELAANPVDATVLPSTQRISQLLNWFTPKTVTPVTPAGGTIGATAANGAEHGTLAPGNFRYRVTGISVTGGESALSANINVTLAAGKNGGTYITWDPVADMLAYNIYGRTTTASDLYIGTVAGAVAHKNSAGTTYRFHDDGSLTPSVAYNPTSQPVAATDTRIELILASDTTDTWFYEIPYDGPVSHTDGAASMGVRLDHRAVRLSGASAQKIPGTLRAGQQNSATIYRGRVYIPVQAAGGTWSLYTLHLDTGLAPTAQATAYSGIQGHLCYADNARRLWVFYRNLAFWSIEPNGSQAVWNGPITVGSSESYINAATMYGGTRNADSALYLAKPEGLYRILDTETGPSARAEMVMELGLADQTIGQVLLEHRGELYVGVQNEMFRYNLGQIDAVSWNKLRGLPVTLDGHARAAASTGRHLYVVVVPPNNDHLTSSLTYGYGQVLETTHGEAWCPVHNSATTQTAPSETLAVTPDRWNGTAIAACSPVETHAIWATLLFAGGESGNRLFRLPIRVGNERLRETQLPWPAGSATPTYGYQPRQAGVLKLPPYYSTRRMVEKAWHWMQMTQLDRTVPDQATLLTRAALITPAKTFGTAQNVSNGTLTGQTHAQGGYLYATSTSNPFRQEFVHAGAGAANRFGRGVSDGIGMEFQLGSGNSVGDLRIPAIMRDPMIAFSEANGSLRTWVLTTVFAMRTTLLDGTVIDTTEAEVETRKQALEAFATNTGVVIVTDPFGDERYVRVDFGYMRVEKRDARVVAGGYLVENLQYLTNVTLTELYSPDAYQHDV